MLRVLLMVGREFRVALEDRANNLAKALSTRFLESLAPKIRTVTLSKTQHMQPFCRGVRAPL